MDLFKILKDPRLLYTAIGVNIFTFILGFAIPDVSLMVLSLGSGLLCYFGIKFNNMDKE